MQKRIDSDKNTPPRYGEEFDLMKYYRRNDQARAVAAEEDVLGLLWLTKLEIE